MAVREARRRLRILHLAFDDHRRPGSGGGAVRNHEVNRRLAEHHDVTAVVVTYPGARPRVEEGVRYLPAGLPLGYYGAILTYFMALPFVVWTRRYDLLVEDFAAPFGSVLVPLWARGRVAAQVQWLSAAEKARQYHLPFQLFERWGTRSHRRLIAVSENVATRLRAVNPRAVIEVIPNGLEPEAMSATGRRGRDALYLGRLEVKGKGLDLLLTAFSQVAPHTRSRLLIAGDGPDREALAGLVRERGLDGRVKLLGRIDGPARFDVMHRARVVCMPSRYETFGLVALEAMACGTPVVAFDIPAMREVLPAEAGVTVPAFDVDAYAAELGSLLEDAPRRRRMRAAGRRAAAGQDWGSIARRQERFYEEAAAAAASQVPALAALAALAAALACVAVRVLLVPSGFEVQVDEPVYLRISQNLAASKGLVYDLSGVYPFFLHPPLEFVLQAGYLKAIGAAGETVRMVIAVRYLAVTWSVLTGAVLLLILRRTAGVWPAVAGLAVFALDPFAVRMGSRNYLEPLAVLWVAAGLWAVLRSGGFDSRAGRWEAPVAGLAFGAAVLTNEPAAIISLVPLAICAAARLVPFRRAATAAAIAVAMYVPYPVGVYASGNWGQFQEQKLSGLYRFAGLNVTTGFNAIVGPSFLQTIASEITQFAPSYALLGLGLLAAIWLAFQRDRVARLVAVWTGCAYVLQAYAVLFGTNEEQYFYYVAVLAIPPLVTAAPRILARPWLVRRVPRARAAIAPAALAVFLAAGLAVAWYRWTAPDDGYLRMVDYMRGHVSAGTRVACTSAVEAVLLQADGYSVTNMARATQEVRRRPRIQDPAVLFTGGARYVVVTTRLVNVGYAIATPAVERWLRANTRLVFSFNGPSDGTVEVFEVPEV